VSRGEESSLALGKGGHFTSAVVAQRAPARAQERPLRNEAL
jgi:hypothetical protein